MKFGIILKSLLFAIILLGCDNKNTNHLNLKQSLVQQPINSTETQSSKINGKIIIIKKSYCETFDCSDYFQDYQKQIQVYPIEDIFMRGISNYLEIENIDEENGRIIINKRTGKDYKKIEIKI
ncbi:MAG TPA: hypothetical protein ENJ95_03135 [Bacteroidetes bacterium]|nr:hypothetical protein [Bacteroidota bacterium]